MSDKATTIARLRAENAAMQHDIATLMEAASHEATEGERLRVEVARLRHLLVEAGAERDAHWAEIERLREALEPKFVERAPFDFSDLQDETPAVPGSTEAK
jgi:predicted  nucleic acid-binding Zn-ribbon protein